MNFYGNSLMKLIDELHRLPGIGKKSAQRIAFHLIGLDDDSVKNFADVILKAKKDIKYCSQCQTLTDKELCIICLNEKRDKSIIMIVEQPQDMSAYERTKEYKGVYHVLHGAISPMNNVSPSDLKIKELLKRLSDDNVVEIIIATNPNVEGEATAMYLSKLIKPLSIKVTRIAHGVPIGGDIEYIDEITLSRALEYRTIM